MLSSWFYTGSNRLSAVESAEDRSRSLRRDIVDKRGLVNGH